MYLVMNYIIVIVMVSYVCRKWGKVYDMLQPHEHLIIDCNIF